MKIYDISMAILPEMKTYPHSPRPTIVTKTSVAEHGFEASKFTLGSHTGTHLETPRHFSEGAKGLTELPLTVFVGPCSVIDLTQLTKNITREDLERKDIPQKGRILLKTRNSLNLSDDFPGRFISLSESAAHYLVEKGILLLGIDELSIEPHSDDYPVHKILSKAGVCNLEGLRLAEVPEGEYFLVAAPLPIDAEASPVRALLIDEKDF
jgi:arylformamidase